MRFEIPLAVGLLTLTLASLAVSGAAGAPDQLESPDPNNTTKPADGPAYGVNNSTFQRLWSADTDQPNLTRNAFDSWNISRPEFFRRLAMTTDVPFDRPPEAVEAWNSGDLQDFTPGNNTQSVHPDGVTLRNSEFIRDAYVATYAVQPSTILHQSNGTTHYIAPEGDVLTTADYRVRTPDDDPIGPVQRTWDISEARIERVVLKTDNETQDAGAGHTTTLHYSGMTGSPTLTVQAEVVVEVEEIIRTCDDFNGSTRRCDSSWNITVEEHSDNVTVTSRREVRVNDLSDATIERVEFDAEPERTGAILLPENMWARMTIDENGGTGVRNTYVYYTAGKENWHELTTSTAIWNESHRSSVRPLQVHAFPRPSGARVTDGLQPNWSQPRLGIDHRSATQLSAPTVPDTFHINSGEPYPTTTRLAVSSIELAADDFEQVTVHGIVRSHSRTVSAETTRTVRATNVSVTILESNATEATLQVRVRENATGAPVTTGDVQVGSASASLSGSGVAIVTVSNPPNLVEARYEPAAWWNTTQPYASSSEVEQLPLTFPSFEDLISLAVVTVLWFIPVGILLFGVDYASDGALLGIHETTTHD